MTAVVMGANLFAGRVDGGRARTRTRTMMIGAALLGGGSLALLRASPDTGYGALVVQLMAIGFGIGLVVPIITAELLSAVDPSRSGLAAGTLNTARQSGSVLGVAILGSLAAGGLTGGLHDAVIACAVIALLVIALASRPRSGAAP